VLLYDVGVSIEYVEATGDLSIILQSTTTVVQLVAVH